MAGDDLRRLRIIAGQTQYQLANEAGVDRTRISLAENSHVHLTLDESKRLVRAILAIVHKERAAVESKLKEVKSVAALFGVSPAAETVAA